MNKRCICLLLLVVVISTLNVSVLAAEPEENGSRMLEELYRENSTSLEIVTPDMELEKENSLLASYIDNIMKANSEYAKFYGGVYLKNGKAIVKLTNTEKEVISFIENSTNTAVNYEKCNASLNELEAISEYILNYKLSCELVEDETLKELLDSIVSATVYIERNEVSVSIKECSDEKIALFQKYVIDSEHIVFNSGEALVNEVSYIKPGQSIQIKINGTKYPYSMGFRCKKLNSNGTYMYGFVTAAHYFVERNNPVYVGNVQIGSVQSVSYANGGNVDASFVQVTNANYDCTTTIYSSGTSLIGGSGIAHEGETVAKAGNATGVTTGIVLSESDWVTSVDGKTIYDLYEVSYSSSEGDSGGVVYSPSSRVVLGIHRGNAGTEMYPSKCAVKVANIKSGLGVSLY